MPFTSRLAGLTETLAGQITRSTYTSRSDHWSWELCPRQGSASGARREGRGAGSCAQGRADTSRVACSDVMGRPFKVGGSRWRWRRIVRRALRSAKFGAETSGWYSRPAVQLSAGPAAGRYQPGWCMLQNALLRPYSLLRSWKLCRERAFAGPPAPDLDPVRSTFLVDRAGFRRSALSNINFDLRSNS